MKYVRENILEDRQDEGDEQILSDAEIRYSKIKKFLTIKLLRLQSKGKINYKPREFPG